MTDRPLFLVVDYQRRDLYLVHARELAARIARAVDGVAYELVAGEAVPVAA